jgi:hypothetical protein
MLYSVIIGVYAGEANVRQIFKALQHQTIPPYEIVIWANRKLSPEMHENCEQWRVSIIESTRNFGCFARFSAAGLLSSDYIMVFDDDTVPGPGWAMNCFATIDRLKGNAILGTRGIILNGTAYHPFTATGIDTGNDHTTECDLVGHSWFFCRKDMHFMFDRAPCTWKTGEDIHFSANAKMAGIRTYCPPHPLSNKAVWGSTQRQLGNAPGRISTLQSGKAHFGERGNVVRYWISKGWKPLFMENKA